eukprot:scaffold25655_cov89-Skeletonema_dohrnii-CCMP3373.AAC.1
MVIMVWQGEVRSPHRRQKNCGLRQFLEQYYAATSPVPSHQQLERYLHGSGSGHIVVTSQQRDIQIVSSTIVAVFNVYSAPVYANVDIGGLNMMTHNDVEQIGTHQGLVLVEAVASQIRR